MRKRSLKILIFAVIMGTTIDAGAQSYRDASLPVDDRVADLLGRMTLGEKAAQLQCLWDSKPTVLDETGAFLSDKASELMPDGIGCLARPSDYQGLTGLPHRYRTARETAMHTREIQEWAMGSRLGIPVLMHEEGLHGLQARGGTHFPQAIALAGTFDEDLLERIYSVVAREIRVRGVHHVLSPVVDVARDARWGRIEETYGEDPFLVGRMGVAAVRGFQGDSMPVADDRVLATLKHMTGHGQPESGTNVGPAQISERTLREMFFPPFEMAIREANAQSVMASYNEIDGVPSHASTWLLGDILRGEWGFDGVVVADYYAIPELMRRHAVAATREEAALLALEAGVDLELPDRDIYQLIPALVEAGELDESVVDQAVARVLTFKFNAGLFDRPFGDPDQAEALTGNDQARSLAVESARKSIVLLKNDGLLPLTVGEHGRIAVIGPNARDVILGGYSDEPLQTVSMLDGIRALVGEQAEVNYAEGARITDTRGWWEDTVTLPDPAEDVIRVEEAVRLARESDVAIVVVGDNEQTSREAWAEAHLGDRTSLTLVGLQLEMVQRVMETGTPTVVVLNHGRPLAITWIAENAPAILDTWYLGQETGTAVAEALFGQINPGAKLPVTVPRSVGQLPMFYNYKPTARRGYLFESTEPLYPFGFGLSYTTFSFENLRLSSDTISADETVSVMVDVTNTGTLTGDEVVQLYIRDEVSQVTRPVKELKGFQRITLEPGETRAVTFEVGPEQLSFYGLAMTRMVEPGAFTLMVGPNSVELETITLTVADD
ncbi:MAG: beta-glucosidase [Rhodothermales bacterium]|nr:beta-glucosidase [Rhodothermales bacterium]